MRRLGKGVPHLKHKETHYANRNWQTKRELKERNGYHQEKLKKSHQEKGSHTKKTAKTSPGRERNNTHPKKWFS